jgi:predicted aspartyl protease
MSKFMVNLTAINPSERQRRTPPVEVMVDTGSELSWLPRKELQNIGINPESKKRFVLAKRHGWRCDNALAGVFAEQKLPDIKIGTEADFYVERDIGYAILQAEGYATNDEIVFAEEGDMTLLGVRTIEGFSVMVDNIGHRFVATATLACNIR